MCHHHDTCLLASSQLLNAWVVSISSRMTKHTCFSLKFCVLHSILNEKLNRGVVMIMFIFIEAICFHFRNITERRRNDNFGLLKRFI